MPPPTTATSNSCSDSAPRAWLRAITRAVSQSARPQPPTGAHGRRRLARNASTALYLRELRADLADRALGVAEQHRGLGVVVELVFDAREAGVHRALDHDHRAAVGDFE